MPMPFLDKAWFCFYTRPRHEKKIKDRLEAQGLEIFCPLMKVRVKWSDRWKKVYKPVIPGYIFAHVREDQRLIILKDPSILNAVFWNKKPVIVRPEEIEAMKYVLLLGERLAEQTPEKGSRVKIVNGSMAGNTGIVMKVSKHAVTIRIDSIQVDFVVNVPIQYITAETK